MDYDTDIPEVRVIRPGDPGFVKAKTAEIEAETEAPVRSRAQEIRDQILTDAELLFRQALADVEEGLELFGLLADPLHKNLPIMLTQLVDQVVEFRRIKG